MTAGATSQLEATTADIYSGTSIFHPPPAPTAHEVPSKHNGTEHRQNLYQLLLNRSVLFYGPANTSCWVSRCNHDYTIITNNMFAILPPDRCGVKVKNSRLLVTNRFYSHMVEQLGDNASFAPHFAALAAILCTSRSTCAHMSAKLTPKFPHLNFYGMLPPDIGHGVANTLPYLLKTLKGVPLRSLHITGVTFYEGGQQYVSGYGLKAESTGRHDADANKNYTLASLASCSDGWGGRVPPIRITLDFPRCHNGTRSRYRATHPGSAPNLTTHLYRYAFYCPFMASLEESQRERLEGRMDPMRTRCLPD